MDHNHYFYVDSSTREPLQALLGRMLWLVIGPLVLILLTVEIILSGRGWLTWDDFVFFATVTLMVMGRWMEIRTGRGRTAFCKPATAHDFRRYVTVFIPCAIVLWVAANAVGNHLLHML